MAGNDQERVLNLLVDRYERSPAFRGEAKVRRAVSVLPRQIYPGYLDGFEPVAKQERFEQEMEALARDGLVELRWDRPPRHELLEIRAAEGAWERIYQLLGRKDAHVLQEEALNFYRTAGETRPTRRYCQEETERLTEGKKARYSLEKARELVRVTDAVVRNDQFLLERELSMKLFHDSKTFEKSWRKPVTELLIRYGDRDYPLEQAQNQENEREIQAIVLGEHGIEPNPSYLFLKGKLTLFFENGEAIHLPVGTSMAIRTGDLDRVSRVTADASFVMTVENLTAFHRVEEPEGICLFLSGFHQAGMEKLLKLLGEGNPNLSWRHFGDADPAGIRILMHLRKRTGLPIQPWHMGLQELQAFGQYGKPLEDYDRRLLKTLSGEAEWAETARWMETHNLKLEQEWVAWFLYARTG